MLERLRLWAARQIFKHLYSQYEFPFASSDDRINRLIGYQRRAYYEKASEVMKNDAFMQEVMEAKRHFYKLLTYDNRQPLLLGALLAIDVLTDRFNKLSALVTVDDGDEPLDYGEE